MMKEDEFYEILLEEKKSNKIKAVLKDIEIVPNYKLKDSPDLVLKLRLKLSLLSENFNMEIPIPIELEKVGIQQALEDLRKFVEREKFSLTLPMIVVSDNGISEQKEERTMKVMFKIKQRPFRLVRHTKPVSTLYIPKITGHQ